MQNFPKNMKKTFRRGFIKQVVFIKYYCVTVLIFILLFPSIHTPAGLPSINFSDALLLFAPFYVGLVVGRIVVDRRVFILLAITFLIILSILWGAILGFNASLGDLFFVFRIGKYLGSIVLASALVFVVGSSGQALRWFLKKNVMIGVGLGLITLQQYFDVFSLNAIYVKYVAPTQYKTLVDGYPWPRPVAMIGNPNELGFLFGLLVIASIWLFIVEQVRSYRWATLAVINFLLMILTISRSATFSILFGLVIFLLMIMVIDFAFWRKGVVVGRMFMKSFLLIILVLIVSSVVVSKTIFVEKFLWRFSSEYVVGAYEVRATNWGENIKIIKSTPFLGVGTLKHAGSFLHAADNEWLLLTRIGGVGLPLLVATLFLSGLVRRRMQLSKERIAFVIAIVGSSFIYMVFAGIFFSLTIMPLILFFLVLAAPLTVLQFKVALKTSRSCCLG